MVTIATMATIVAMAAIAALKKNVNAQAYGKRLFICLSK